MRQQVLRAASHLTHSRGGRFAPSVRVIDNLYSLFLARHEMAADGHHVKDLVDWDVREPSAPPPRQWPPQGLPQTPTESSTGSLDTLVTRRTREAVVSFSTAPHNCHSTDIEFDVGKVDVSRTAYNVASRVVLVECNDTGLSGV